MATEKPKLKATPNKAKREQAAETAADRLKNPIFIAAAVSFLYKGYESYAELNGLPSIPQGDFQLAVDLLTYGFLGYGVYSVFPKQKKL